MKVEHATTPLRQLYFIVQIMLMNPVDFKSARDMFEKSVRMIMEIIRRRRSSSPGCAAFRLTSKRSRV